MRRVYPRARRPTSRCSGRTPASFAWRCACAATARAVPAPPRCRVTLAATVRRSPLNGRSLSRQGRARMKAKRKPPEIQFQEVIGEAAPGDYQMVRLSRVKYRKNPYTFIDIRVFQRAYDEDGEDVYHPTKKGVHLL